MPQKISWRVILPAALTAAVFSFSAIAQSQDQQAPSVADAARRAREQKKKAEKPAPVISDDTLKPAPTGVTGPAAVPAASPQGARASSPEGATPIEAARPAAPSTPPAETAPSDKKESVDNSAEASAMKAQLEDLEKELDLLRREVPLERDNFYSKPDYARDTAGKSKLDALVQQMTDKQQDVDALKARVAALVEQAAKEQPASTEKPATPPKP